MPKDQFRGKIEHETSGEKLPPVAMPPLSTGKLPRVPGVQQAGGLPGGLERGAGAIEEAEALEFARQFELEFDLAPEDVRPCVASIYYQGVVSEREPYAFLLASELHNLGVGEDAIENAVRTYSSRLGRHLFNSEIAKFRRKFQSGRYDKPYGCHRQELKFFCIGEICPYRATRGGKATKGPILAKFYSLGWPQALKDSYAVNIYLGLQHLRQLKSLPPDGEFRFNYPRLERLTGVPRALLSGRLQKLESVGLIAQLAIGSKWGSERQRTRIKLAWPIPEPKLGVDYVRSS